MDELRAKCATNFEARNVQNVQNCMKLSRKACCKLTSIELDVHTAREWIAREWKRAANFEARNVQNVVKLWYAREACCKLRSIQL